MGAAYGTAKSGMGIQVMGIQKPELVMKSVIPVVMAGVIGIYGLIIAVIIGNKGGQPPYSPPAPRTTTSTPRPRWVAAVPCRHAQLARTQRVGNQSDASALVVIFPILARSAPQRERLPDVLKL